MASPKAFGRSDVKYRPGDKVFAKIAGFAPWPARIESIASETPKATSYNLYYYGTGETGTLRGEKLCPFLDNVLKFGLPKKRKLFNEALSEIEEELSDREKDALSLKRQCLDSGSEDSQATDDSVESLRPRSPAPPPSLGQPCVMVAQTPGFMIVPPRDLIGDVMHTDIGVEIPLKLNTPKFDDPQLLNDWIKEVFLYAVSLHKRASSGLIFPEDITAHMHDWTLYKKHSFQCPDHSNEPLPIETRMLDAVYKIRSCLSITEADTESGLKFLEDLAALELTSEMLRNHPEVIDTVCDASFYDGNLSAWSLDEEQENKFSSDAVQIRQKASQLYDKYLRLL